MVKIGLSVETPYGHGVLKNVRESDGLYIVEPKTWKLANNKPPIFYLNPKDVKQILNVGDYVQSIFGKGIIQGIRDDCIFVVTLFNWKLANDKSPTLFLNESSLTRIEIVKEPETVPLNPLEQITKSIEESLNKSQLLKSEAASLYKKKDYSEARLKYFDALSCLRFEAENLSNDLKARAFEQTVPCHNNIALCSLNLGDYPDCINFARNSVMLINALQQKMVEGSAVWESLVKNREMTLDKLLEWKKKSYFYMGKAELARKEYESAISNFETAIQILSGISTSSSMESLKDLAVLKDLLNQAKKSFSAEVKKEKSTWTKAFKENSALPGDSSTSNNTKDGNKSSSIDKNKTGSSKSPSKSSTANKSDKNGKLVKGIHSFYGWAIGLGLLSALGGVAFILLKNRRFR